MPTFEVRLREGHTDPPTIEIGVFSKHLDQPFYTSVPMDTPRKGCYEAAETLCVYINQIVKPGWEAQWDRQHLYTDFSRLHWIIRENRERWEVRINRELEPYFDHQKQVRNAEQVAFDLLNEVNPELAKKVLRGKPFYLQGARFIYIVNAERKKIDVLFPAEPKSLCVYIKDTDVQHNKYDWSLAMWKYLTASEEHVLTTANEFDFYLSDTEEVIIGPEINTQAEAVTEGNRSKSSLSNLQRTGQTGAETQEG